MQINQMDNVYAFNVNFKTNYKAMDGLLGGYVKQCNTVYDNA